MAKNMGDIVTDFLMAETKKGFRSLIRSGVRGVKRWFKEKQVHRTRLKSEHYIEEKNKALNQLTSLHTQEIEDRQVDVGSIADYENVMDTLFEFDRKFEYCHSYEWHIAEQHCEVEVTFYDDTLPDTRYNILKNGTVSEKAMRIQERNTFIRDYFLSYGARYIREVMVLIPVDSVTIQIYYKDQGIDLGCIIKMSLERNQMIRIDYNQPINHVALEHKVDMDFGVRRGFRSIS